MGLQTEIERTRSFFARIDCVCSVFAEQSTLCAILVLRGDMNLFIASIAERLSIVLHYSPTLHTGIEIVAAQRPEAIEFTLAAAGAKPFLLKPRLLIALNVCARCIATFAIFAITNGFLARYAKFVASACIGAGNSLCCQILARPLSRRMSLEIILPTQAPKVRVHFRRNAHSAHVT